MKTKAPVGRVGKDLRRCFMSAPFGCDLSLLIERLAAFGVRSRRLDSLKGNQSLTKALLRELQRADFVCVVFPNGFEIASTLFELGIAIGLRKPTMVLAESDVSLPIDIAQWPIGRISLKNPETINVAVRPLLRTLQASIQRLESSPSQEAPAASAPLAALETRLFSEQRRLSEPLLKQDAELSNLALIRTLPPGERGQAFEVYIASLFEKVGITAALEGTQDARGIDLAIWLNDVARVLSNPILVELKIRMDLESWKQASAQLTKYMISARAQCGLMISLDAPPLEVPRVTKSLPLVVTMAADELVPLLATKSLGKELIRMRNQAVHG